MAAAAAILAALSAASPIVGGVVGENMSADDRDSAEGSRMRALIELSRSDPQIGGVRAEDLGPSAYNDIQVDPRLRDAQMNALRQLQEEGLSGGLSPQDRLKQAQAIQASQQAAQGQRQAILANMAARGQGGSGAELAAQLANQQASAQQMNQAGMQSAADANQRALAAIAAGGALGGQMEAQQYGEAANRARATDLINQYNASQRYDAQNQNLRAREQEFQNRLAKAGAYNGASGYAQQAADNTLGTWAGIGQGVGQGFAAGAQFAGSGKGGK